MDGKILHLLMLLGVVGVICSMADSNIAPMTCIVKERFHSASYKVFSYEGCQVPEDLEDYGESGDIFAFQGIGGHEVEQHIYVKTYVTK